MSRPTPSPPFIFGGRHLLLLMLGFFGVVIAVNALLAALAGRSWTGLVVQNAYVASQHYNEELKGAHRQQALGWRSELTTDPQRIVLVLHDRANVPVSGLLLEIRLSRATHEGEDRTLHLRECSPGLYCADIELPQGLWLAELRTLEASAVSYRKEYRLIVKEAH